MTTCERTGTERLVKSTDRVRDLGEVFTPAATVQSMLDLLPSEMWEVPTFLEPACGDGNFLVAILARKLERIGAAHESGTLPAGPGIDAMQFHALEALASIYAMDSPDNVAGGNLFHGPGARDRMLSLIDEWWATRIGRRLAVDSRQLAVAQWIADRNIQVANMLEVDGAGRPTRRDAIPRELEASDPLTDEPGWRRIVDLEGARVDGLVRPAVARQGGTWADLLATLTTLVSTLHEAGWQTVRQHSEESGEHGDSVLLDLERSGVSIEVEFYEHGTLVAYPLGREADAADDATSEALFVLDDATSESSRQTFAAQGWLEPPSGALPRP